ncbi:hypothetical protein I7I50_02049 [Histoplasma capsulatum G186AR]|uniref:Uncharacterized protein n=1 Tax=Ajellomyces capsulatus TaxID=5037 RepID=A0A8H7YAB9_AJECA|nr:hypothetical protein I7I52_12263 [Histoplasma capsulatum]QSS71276.1 hypothetical protein I7I50_02049 [Histoplasma capsulatum G186AR]
MSIWRTGGRCEMAFVPLSFLIQSLMPTIICFVSINLYLASFIVSRFEYTSTLPIYISFLYFLLHSNSPCQRVLLKPLTKAEQICIR